MKLQVLLVMGMLLPVGAACAEHDLEAEPRTYELRGVKELSLDFPVGELNVEGDDGTTVRVSVRVHCKSGSLEDCQDRARKVAIDRRQTGSTLTLKIENGPERLNTRWLSIEAKLFVPHSLATRIKMGVGALTIRGHRGDLDLELGVGDLKIYGAERDYRAVRGEVGVGDVTIRTKSGAAEGEGFIGHSANWEEGKGPSKTSAHVGVGSVTVVLD
jgi:hypothetical protein